MRTSPTQPADHLPVDLEPLRGPAFSSFEPADVAWLLKDLSNSKIDRGIAEGHVADSTRGLLQAELAPVEERPSVEHQQLAQWALKRYARSTALAVGVVTELALNRLDISPVIVSIMRAGTPAGILMRRWAQSIHGIDLQHYAVSITQATGIDRKALRWIAARHDPKQVLFVDGWTGKGTVVRKVAECLAAAAGDDGIHFDPTVAVLSDPGRCTSVFGTRDDYLIPFACADSTSSGLISRTLDHPWVTGPEDFHGARYHRHLADSDMSRIIVDTVASHFSDVAESVMKRRTRASHHIADWSGRREAEAIARRYQLDHLDLVKCGVSETTRILVQWKANRILIRDDTDPDLAHILPIADDKGIPIDKVPELPFACIALVPPRQVVPTNQDGGGPCLPNGCP